LKPAWLPHLRRRSSWQLEGTRYIARGRVNNPANVRKTKNYIRGLQDQMAGIGFTMVENTLQCPTQLGMAPIESIEWLEKTT
jgi:2-oxoglutarate ferredoxin oxidoreductase subunit beta